MTTTTRDDNPLLGQTQPAADALVQTEDGAIRCFACGNRCLIRPGASGICRMRTNVDGVLRVPAGYVSGLAIDPIEKKPFYHVMPGRNALSFGMLGCNLHCAFCQNWISSQALRDPRSTTRIERIDADRLVQIALQSHAPIATSTYNEPLITSEWAVEIFRRCKPHGIKTGYVSNGNATPEVLEYLRPHLDLYKVDLKCFDDTGYRTLGCPLANVTDSIRRIKELGYWIEVVTLIVPGFNDDEDQLRRLCEFLASVDVNIPWHCTAFHPDYQMDDTPATSPDTLRRAYELGQAAGLRFVYPGNLRGGLDDLEHTRCPSCDTVLIERSGFHVRANHMNGSRCPHCHTEIPGVWA